jgi:transposase-like protein
MKHQRTKTNQEREAIIAEYLIGDSTYRKLGLKHGVDFRILHSWVTKFRGGSLKKDKPNTQKQSELKDETLPTDVKQLQSELRKAKLYNELLNAMIDIAEDQLKIDIRKKSGTKR